MGALNTFKIYSMHTYETDAILTPSVKKCYGIYLGAPVNTIYFLKNYIHFKILNMTLL